MSIAKIKPLPATIKRRKKLAYSPESGEKFWFDDQSASDAVDFIETFCTHVEGEWAGTPFLLADWQKILVRELFGWKRYDADSPEECTRQYRALWLEVPRKNGKSALAAALVLLVLVWDREPGAQLYSAAGDRDQASLVFNVVKQMVEQCPELAEHIAVFGGNTGQSKRCVYKTKFYRPLSADANTKHGFNTHLLVCDEVHVQPNRDLLDTLRTSMGSRRQPLGIYITTAGSNRNSICWEMHSRARQIIDNSYNKAVGVEDHTWLPYIFAANPEADWTDPDTWASANPNFPVTPKKDFLEEQCLEAQASKEFENTFKRLYLNIWTEQAVRFFQMERWRACGGDLPTSFGQRRCWAGMDLASTTDITALVFVFEPTEERPKIDIVPFFWIPEERMEERVRRDKVPYSLWVEKGLMYTTEGDVVDYDAVVEKALECGEKWNVQEIAYDNWNATQPVTDLQNAGFDGVHGPEMVKMGQNFSDLSAATKGLLVEVLHGRVCHGDSPVLEWMANNLSVKTDPGDRVKPDKTRSAEKIDGIVATIMGFRRLSLALETRKSAYADAATREFITL